jgi:hypothetical protein
MRAFARECRFFKKRETFPKAALACLANINDLLLMGDDFLWWISGKVRKQIDSWPIEVTESRSIFPLTPQGKHGH